MLELIRKYSKSIVVKVFLTILSISFFFFFAFPIIADKLMGKDYVVKIANIKISPQVFKYEKNKKLSAIKRRLKNDEDVKELSNKILHQIIWENVVNLAAKDFGVIVSDSTMYSHISNMDVFRTDDGHFNAMNLRRFLRALDVSEEEFLQSSRRDIKSHIIQFPFNYISLTDEFEYYSKIEVERRNLKFLEIDPTSFRIKEVPTDEDLEEFYNDNPEKFEVPEKRSFDVLILSMNKVESGVNLPQEEIIERARDLYGEDYTEKSLKKFLETEDFKNFKQEKVAEAAEEITRQIEDDLVSGSTVEEVTKKYDLRSINVKNVALNETDQIGLPFKKDIMTVAFGSDEKEVGDFNEAEDSNKKLVQWMVYVSDITPKHIEPIEQAKEKVKIAWYKHQQHDRALSVANEIISKVVNGESFFDLAKKAKYRLRSTAYFDREGRTSDERNNSEIISSLCEESFNRLKNDIGLKDINGKIVVYQVVGMNYDEKSERDNKRMRYNSLLQDNSGDMYQQLIGYLSKKYEVKVNYDVLKEVDESIDPTALDDVF